MPELSGIKQVTDYASQQDDRWLFIAILLVLLLASLGLWRWLTTDREKIAKRLTEVTDRHIESQQKMTEVVARNSEVVARNTEVVEENSRAIADVRGVIALCKTKNQP